MSERDVPSPSSTERAGESPLGGARQFVEPPVDEAHDFDIGVADVVLGVLTLPLLFWVLMYAFTGGERLFATRRARYHMYAWLLAAEAVIVGGVVLWLAS